MKSIFAKLLYLLEKKVDTMLVTIVWEDGSVPRGVGSQMLVSENGRVIGTIGGGAVEHVAEQMAKELLREKCSAKHDFRLHKNAKEDIGMVCGGDVTVWFQYVAADESLWGTLAACIVEQIAKGNKGWLVQKMDGSLPTLLDANGKALIGEQVFWMNSWSNMSSISSNGIFASALPVGERAVIFGGGHCAQALAPLLKSVGFRVTVMDCRPEYASEALFPSAEHVICGDYLKVSDYLSLTEDDYVVIMTNGHSFDFEIQEQVLRGPLAYVGVIGSRSKTAAVNQRLRERGVPEDAISSVHTPIGTAIKAVTPEEIAVSIAGEMIYERALRRESNGVFLHGCPMH